MIDVKNLFKYYNGKIILNDINLHIGKGDIVGILGPNGAGKTTLIETIEGLRKIDRGEIRVMGQDIKKNYKNVQRYLGIQLQKNSLIDDLTIMETIQLFQVLYLSKENIESLINQFQLDECKHTLVKYLSGGQFQRLKLCLVLLNEPSVIFLDEPTTGLDPKARSVIWQMIKELAKKNITIILTTHYMEEAEYLCNKIIIIDSGRIIVEGTPLELINNLSLDHIITLDFDEKIIQMPILKQFQTKISDKTIYIYTSNLTNVLFNFLNEANEFNLSIKNIKINQANLEDVFFYLTQKQLKNEKDYSII